MGWRYIARRRSRTFKFVVSRVFSSMFQMDSFCRIQSGLTMSGMISGKNILLVEGVGDGVN